MYIRCAKTYDYTAVTETCKLSTLNLLLELGILTLPGVSHRDLDLPRQGAGTDHSTLAQGGGGGGGCGAGACPSLSTLPSRPDE